MFLNADCRRKLFLLIELGCNILDWNSEVPGSRVMGGVSQLLGAPLFCSGISGAKG